MSERNSRFRGAKLFILCFAAICAVGVLGLGALVVIKPAAVKRVARWIKHKMAAENEAPKSGAALVKSVDFDRDVHPILSANCIKCHGPEKQKGGLRFDEKGGAFAKGESGDEAIVLGDAARSSLIRRIKSHDADEQMPPKGERVSRQSVAVLERWIDEGADWPENGDGPKIQAASKASGTDHWAYQPLAKVSAPKANKTDWALTPIDAFILSAQEAKGINPNPEASRRALIRRLYFDLIGLPPPPKEIEAFEKDPSPKAYERLVDRLLADSRFGERWGRHWLDVARYADSAGYEEDRPRPDAYQYRDFVIRALDSDLPYDKFIQWQIAGDILEPKNPEAVAATGFIAAAPDVRPEFINFRKKDRCDELDDIVSTTGSAVLGLTIGCARCHDHKFDPITSQDYYRLTAFFTGTERVERAANFAEEDKYNRALADYEKRLKKVKTEEKDWKEVKREAIRKAKVDTLPVSPEEKALLKAPPNQDNVRQSRLLARFGQELDISDGEVRKQLQGDDIERWKSYDKVEDEIRGTKPASIPRILAIHEGVPKKTYLLLRGDPNQEGQEVSPGTLSILTAPSGATSFFDRFFRSRVTRGDLARWLTDERHGAGALTARVAVNRMWQHHFGRGLVNTPGDFGVRGDAPTNPALLDWLASEFIRGGWRAKSLHKAILMSAVYRQDVMCDDARVALDPGNTLWWRREPERIEAEILRDSILTVSGCLNTQQFGPAVKPWMSPEAISITNREKHYDEWPGNVVEGRNTWRRSIYIFAKRSNLFPFLQAFDAPSAAGSCARRNRTTVAPQALALLNDPFVRGQAQAFARRLHSSGEMEERVKAAFELALGRPPHPEEKTGSLRFIDQQANDYRENRHDGDAETAALTDFCQGLMALNEFSYID